jgi:hypothetical protein
LSGRLFEAQVLEKSWRELRKLQLLLQLFNGLSSNTVLAIKTGSNALTVLSLFFAVRYFHERFLLSLFYSAVALNVSVFFIGLYDGTFSIPLNMKGLKGRVKMAARLSASALQDPEEVRRMRVIQKGIRSIPPLGIKVGVFNTLQRQTTPNFVMFVLFNLGRMIVTFK